MLLDKGYHRCDFGWNMNIMMVFTHSTVRVVEDKTDQPKATFCMVRIHRLRDIVTGTLYLVRTDNFTTLQASCQK